MEGHYLNITESVSLLEMQEKESYSTSLKDHIISLKLGLRFLKTFLRFSDNEYLKKRISYLVYNVWNELYSLSKRPQNESLIRYLGSGYSRLCEKMKNVIIEPRTSEYDVTYQRFFENVSYFKKINDFLVKFCGDLSTYKDDLKASLMEEIEDIKEKLTSLKALLVYLANRKVHVADENKESLTPLIAVFDEASYIFFSCLFDKIDEDTTPAIKRKLSDLCTKIDVKEIYMVVLRASHLSEPKENFLENEFYVLENQIWLLDCNVCLSDPSLKLHEELKILKSFLIDMPHDLKIEKFNYLVTSIKAITCMSSPILYSCYDKYLKEGMAREVNGALSEVLDQINHIHAEVLEIKLNNYPKTDELGFLDLLLGHLKELLTCQPELIETIRLSLETLLEKFYYLRSSLREMKDDQEFKELRTHIMSLAYQAEYVIDLCLVKSAPDSRIMFTLSKIIDQIIVIVSKVKSLYREEKNDTQVFDIRESSRPIPWHSTAPTDTELVGFQDEEERIIDHLVDGMKQLQIVSIVGMGGLGKTTLAKKIYEDDLIVEHFDVRAWCSVSQTFKIRDLLLTMLGCIMEITGEICQLSNEELAAKLYKSLKGYRYLIVIDDIWNLEAWDYLKRSFPDDRTHSRILITTRLQNVASQIRAHGKVHILRQLSDDESWELFEKMLSPKDWFPQELLKVGQSIAHSCKGLPLLIIVVAGVLSYTKAIMKKWKQIAKIVSSHDLSDLESLLLKLRYYMLPDHMKSCFLYIGAFLEAKEISAWKLQWLWIAEGFVRRNSEEMSLENVAEKYFTDLISKSLLIATKERSQGGVKSFHVHDLIRDFCLEKVKKRNLLQVIHVGDGSKFSRVYDQYRLSIYCNVGDLVKAKPSGGSIRSLVHNSTMYLNCGGMDVSFIFQNFKLLRVMDLACINIGKYFNGIELLIHLRYLAFKAETNSILSSIVRLWNLQFLLVEVNRHYGSEVVNVPDSIWDMVKLRHVQINHSASFNVQKSRLECSSLLENLETLSTPCLSYGEDAENLLRRLPKLRKLSCIFLDYRDDADEASKYPVLDFLDHLVSLKVNFYKSMERPKKCEFGFPSNLQKLTLLNFEIPWESISEIGRTLPNLKVLKLIGWGSNGKWIIDNREFPQLRYLKLKYLKFDDWIASDDSFPVLEQLVVDDCSNLSQIPPSFGEIPTLLKITVRNCEPSVDNSAMSIKNDQADHGNEGLKVSIYPNTRYSE